MIQSAQPQINIAPDQHFSCTSCGKCCRSQWRIKVEEEKIPGIKATQAYQNLERQGYVPLPVVDGQRQVGRKSDGACQFLGESGCQIHSELDGFKKPSVCQLFPFNLVNTPDGYFVSLSHSCPAVLAGTGNVVSAQLEDLQRTVSESPYFSDNDESVKKEVTLTEDKVISWEDYCELEQAMLASIGTVDPVRDIVKLAASMIGAGIANEALEFMPFFAANTISVLERPDDHDERQIFASELLNGEIHSNLLGRPIDSFRICEPKDLMTKQILVRYIKSIIWGKRLVTGPTVVTRLLMLATSLSIVLFYLEQKLSIEDSHFDFDALEWAFDLVESSIYTHSEDMQPLFLEYERALVSMARVEEAA